MSSSERADTETIVPAPYDRSRMSDGHRIALALERIANAIESNPAESLMTELQAMMTAEGPEPPGPVLGNDADLSGGIAWAEKGETMWTEIDLPVIGYSLQFELLEDHNFRLWLRTPGGGLDPLVTSGG